MRSVISIIKSLVEKNSEYLQIILLLVFLNIIFFPNVWIRKEIITPADSLLQYEPWKNLVDQDFKAGNNLITDIARSGHPIQSYLYNRIHEGDLSFWNYLDGLGSARGTIDIPLVLFDPLFFISSFLSGFHNLGFAITSSALGHSFLCGFFTYLLLRKYKIGKAGSTLGAIIGSFSLYNIVYLITSVVHVSTFIPLVLWAIERIFEKTSKKNVSIFIACYSLLFLGGFYSTVFYASLMFISYIILKSLFRYLNRELISIILKRLVVFFLSGLIAGGLLAFSLLPSARYLTNKVDISYRKESHSERYISKDLLIRYLIPEYYGSPVDHNWQRLPFKPSPSNNYNESAMYIGLFSLILSIFSLFKVKKDKKILFFFCVVLFSSLIIFNIGPFLDIVSKLPIFSSNPSTRLTVLVSFSLTILAAYGFDFLLKKESKQLVRKIFPFLIFLYINIFLFIIFRTLSFTKGLSNLDARISKELLLTFAYLVNTLFGIWLFISKRFPQNIFIIMIIVISFVDLYRVGSDYNPTIETELFYPETNAITFLQDNTQDHSRILTFDRIMFVGVPIYYNLNTLTRTSHYDQRWVDFVNYIQPDSIELERETIKFKKSKLDLSNQLLDLVGLKYILDYSWDIPIWKTPIVQVKEYNLPIALGHSDMLSRTFKITRDQKINGISLRIKKFEKLDDGSLLLRINQQNTNTIIEELSVDPTDIISGETLDISLPNTLHMTPGKYSLTIQWTKNSKNVVVFWGSQLNKNKTKKLEKNDRLIQADLSYALYEENLQLKDKYTVVYNDEVQIYKNKKVFQRAFMTHKYLITENKDETFHHLTTLEEAQELDSTVVIENPNAEISLEQCKDMSKDKVNITEYSAQRIVLRSTSHCDSILVLSDLYDSDWNSYIDNKPVETLKVDYLLRGVYTPSGDHTIVMEYKPHSFSIGVKISLITIFGIFLYFISIPIVKYAKKRKRR